MSGDELLGAVHALIDLDSRGRADQAAAQLPDDLPSPSCSAQPTAYSNSPEPSPRAAEQQLPSNLLSTTRTTSARSTPDMTA